MIKYLEKESLEEVIRDGVYIVDFYAEWCGPCKMLGSVLEKLEDINILKINTDIHQELAQKYGVMSVPTILFTKNGIEVKRVEGFISEEEIHTILNNMK